MRLAVVIWRPRLATLLESVRNDNRNEEVIPKWKFAFIVTSQICLKAFRIQNDQFNNWNRHGRMRKEKGNKI